MAAPIYNPVIPCVHPIPAGMYPGRMIRVQGSTPPGAQRFAINLQCGPNTDPRDDIALHLNFRFVEMCVVRNHLTAMNWGVEDTAGGMPLRPGDSFEALILCEPQSLKIALNGMHFCEFLHRLPFQRISHITVDGDAMVQFIGFEGAPPPQQQMYMSEPPAYGQYGAPPAYGAPGYGPPQGVQPQGTRPQAVGYPPLPEAGGPQYAQGPPQYAQAPRRGMGAGAATGLGVGALAAGGLAGYALGGGFGGGGGSPQAVDDQQAPSEDPHDDGDVNADNAVDDHQAPSEDPQDDGDVNADNDWLSEEQAPEVPPETEGETPEDNDWLSEEQPTEETLETEAVAPEDPAPEEPAPEENEPENEPAEDQAPPEEEPEDIQHSEEEHGEYGGDDDFGGDDWMD